LVCYVVLAPLAAVVGLLGCFVQQDTVLAGGVSLPLGALLALAACAGLFVSGATLTGTALGAGVPTVCWLLTVISLTYSGGGDVILPDSGAALLYLFGGTLLGALAVMGANFVTTRRRIMAAGRDAGGRS
jgi:hypothetical protein